MGRIFHVYPYCGMAGPRNDDGNWWHKGDGDQEQAIAAGCPMGFPGVDGCKLVTKLYYYYYY